MKNERINPFHRVVHLLSTKKRIFLCLIMLINIFLGMVLGCNREARYKILTFFFEGVPPLGSENQTVETETTMDVDELSQTHVAGEKSVSRPLRQKRTSKHKPVSDCSTCHIGGMLTGERQLARPMPDLCYSCHTDYNAVGGYLHGPIAVGECSFCHDSHYSKYVYLQKAPQPELCYQCHLRENIATIAGHQENKEMICTKCHDPHVSSMKKLLKSPKKFKNDPNTVNLSK